MTALEPRLAVRYGRFLFRHRNILFPAVLLALFIGFRPRYPEGLDQLDHWADALGLVVALAGQALRAAVIGYVYILRGGRDHQVYAEELVTGGFFAHARNPLYLGNILILIGLFLIHGNPWVLLLGSGFFLSGYGAIVAAEEDYLGEKFGVQYTDYAARVPRWIPRLRGLRQSLAGMEYNWRRVISKEYGSMFMWMAGAVLLLRQDLLAYHTAKEAAHELTVYWEILGLLLAAWGAARVLKKTGRLKRPAP